MGVWIESESNYHIPKFLCGNNHARGTATEGGGQPAAAARPPQPAPLREPPWSPCPARAQSDGYCNKAQGTWGSLAWLSLVHCEEAGKGDVNLVMGRWLEPRPGAQKKMGASARFSLPTPGTPPAQRSHCRSHSPSLARDLCSYCWSGEFGPAPTRPPPCQPPPPARGR